MRRRLQNGSRPDATSCTFYTLQLERRDKQKKGLRRQNSPASLRGGGDSNITYISGQLMVSVLRDCSVREMTQEAARDKEYEEKHLASRSSHKKNHSAYDKCKSVATRLHS